MLARCIFFILILISTQSFGQHLPDSFFSSEWGIGPRTMQTEAGSYTMTFNDSAGEEYSFTKEIKNPFTVVGLHIALSWGKYEKFTHTVYTDFPANKSGSGKFGYAVGYNFPIEVGKYDILIEPSAGYTQGKTRFDFGEIRADSTGVNFFGKDFESEVVDFMVTQRSRYLNAMLKFTFLKRQERAFSLEFGYDWQFQDRGQNIDISGSQSSTRLYPLVDAPMQFTRTVDGTTSSVNENFFRPGGFRVTLIYGFYRSKDKFD